MWVPVREAADRLNVSEDTIRRRVKASALTSRREPTPSGFRWLVELPGDAPAPPLQTPAPDSHYAPADAQAGGTAELRELVDVLKAEVGTLTAALAARDRDIDRLTILLQRAQQSALTQPAPASAPAGAQAARGQRSESFWRVLARRWFHGRA